MPIFLLGEEPVFPPAILASREGIIATGGDLSPARLLNAYASGIFPWYSQEEPILWWSPDPRLVLFPGKLHISGSMKKILKKKIFQVTFDRSFERIIKLCAVPRPEQGGTWLSKEMQRAYIRLHHMGYAHSVEVWEIPPKREGQRKKRKRLAGGLYGVSLGRCFFGESMFTRVPNASKAGFIHLAQTLFDLDFLMIDCQVPTGHLKRMGAEEVSRIDFLALLQRGLEYDSIIGNWDFPSSGIPL
jgi:leucyl/phenylalanyl-tRNA--protein transferase